MIKLFRFNIYLLTALSLVLLTGCPTIGQHKPKESAFLEFHLESRRDAFTDVQTVPIYRANPIYLNVAREPFMKSADIEGATVVDELGGFVIRLKFGQEGTQILSTISGSNPGKHMAILCITDSSRWLAAPVIQKQIPDGVITFTPDATREEAEKIVRGLKAINAIVHKDDL